MHTYIYDISNFTYRRKKCYTHNTTLTFGLFHSMGLLKGLVGNKESFLSAGKSGSSYSFPVANSCFRSWKNFSLPSTLAIFNVVVFEDFLKYNIVKPI